MNKLTLFFLLLFAVSFGSAQTLEKTVHPAGAGELKNTMEVNDFTVVDSDGVEWNLYTLLEGGTTVILDLFQST